MRNITFMIAVLVVIVASPSVAGSSQGDLPGIGTFSYSGAPVAAPAPALVVAGLTRAERS